MYILDLFSLTLLQDASLSSSRLGDYVCIRRLAMTVLIFLCYGMKLAELGILRQLSCHLIYNGAVDFFLDPDTTCRVTYCQARGLSRCTSPSGECSAFFYPPY
jgi:hypothetical protein